MKRRFGSTLLVAVLVVGAIFAVLQPNRPPAADAAPFLNNAPSVCTSIATTTGTTTALGTLVTSTVSTIVSTITTISFFTIPQPPPFPPFIFPGEPIVTTVTTTTVVPVTETTAATETTTGYVTSTVDCPSTTSSTSSTTTSSTTTSMPTTSSSTSAIPATNGNSAVSGLVSVDNGQPLADATVLVGGSVTKTDTGGHYLIAHLPAGSYIVSVSYPSGYRAASPNSYTAILDGTNQDAFDFYGTSSPAGAGFQPFWAETFRPAVLRSGTNGAAISFGAVPQWSFLLVVQPEVGGWLYVYNPKTHNYGYIAADNVGPSGPPH